ncbi:MAG TPA: hypothetical protein VNS22_06740 [Geminicoccus sp.]|uniref:hypothetical protein n=1 Tax=Geminicoccus sp. TaxID=2024832 RepID=UPI002C14B7C8|nr:hypothetical protein [Geminicoccus sp.]HWL68066.1 hypothetical protein [Geminicoccus sp.]
MTELVPGVRIAFLLLLVPLVMAARAVVRGQPPVRQEPQIALDEAALLGQCDPRLRSARAGAGGAPPG